MMKKKFKIDAMRVIFSPLIFKEINLLEPLYNFDFLMDACVMKKKVQNRRRGSDFYFDPPI